MTDAQWFVFIPIYTLMSFCIMTTIALIIDYTFVCILKEKKLGNTRGSIFLSQTLLTMLFGIIASLFMSFGLRDIITNMF